MVEESLCTKTSSIRSAVFDRYRLVTDGPGPIYGFLNNTHMASAGARAYNGGLGAEPLAGVQGAAGRALGGG